MSKSSLGNVIKLLEFIRRNTDKDHPATQDSLRKMMGEDAAKELMGDKGTYARRLNELADACNTDESGEILSEDKWKIVFPGYGRSRDSGKRNGKVYYSHPVSEEELSILIDLIRNTHNFTKEEKESLERRLREYLASKHYDGPEKFEGCIIRNLDDPSDDDKSAATQIDFSKIEENICKLRDYMKNGLMANISVRPSEKCNGKKAQLHQVSPYRIVYKDSCYWLIANRHQRPADTCPDPDRKYPWYTDLLTAYRIDLIEEISDAYVEDQTIHWTMTQFMISGRYTRRSAGSHRKARHGRDVMNKLKKYDEAALAISLEHCKDIKI